MGAWGATFFVAGNMIGSGIYMLPATLAATGSITILSWVGAAAGAMVLALVFALLGILRPTADGAVAYGSEGLGSLFGHMGWYGYQMSNWVGLPGIAVAAVGYLAYFFPALKVPALGAAASLAVIWLGVAVCLLGPRMLGRISGATLLIGLAPIVVAIGVGVAAFDPAVFSASWNVSGRPDAIAASSSVLPVFWAFLGLETANMIAAGIDNPRRNLPIAAIGGVALAAVVYIAATGAIMGLEPASRLAVSTAPFADAVVRVAGPLTAALVAFCAFAKAFGAVAGWTMVTAEADRAAAVAGFLPKIVSEVSPDRRPVRDLFFAGLLMSAVLLATISPTLGKQFAMLINITVIMTMIQYLVCAVALVRLARHGATPGTRLAARAAGLFGAGFAGWVIVTMDPSYRLPTALMVGVGLLMYAGYRLGRARAAAAAAA